MRYDKALVAGKLRRWETYLNNYRLPTWEQIPDLGLYMEQVIVLLRQYLDYLPPELKEEQQFITAAAINNYVRTRIMPQPRKKRYYREHIAYLIMILTLKPTLSMALIQRLTLLGKIRPLAYLGDRSYMIYLLHQNMGYMAINFLLSRGVENAPLCIAAAHVQ